MEYMYLRTSITDSYPNKNSQKSPTNLEALLQEVKMVKQNEDECVVFNHKNYPNKTLWCVKRWAYVVQQGSPIHLLYPEITNNVLEEVVTQGNPNYHKMTNRNLFFVSHDHRYAEYISRIRVICIVIDNANRKTRENITKPAGKVTM